MNSTSPNPSTRSPTDDEVAARARAIFASACDNIDSFHSRRLDLARRQAVRAHVTHSTLRMWAPLAGAAACCVLVVGVVWMRPSPRVAPATRTSTEIRAAPAIATDATAMVDVGSGQADMVQNLDFYRWLATQPAVAVAPDAGGN